MARHSAQGRRFPLPWLLPALLVLVVGVVAGFVAVRDGQENVVPTAAGGGCDTTLRVVTAASFARVLADVQPAMLTGDDCARLDVVIADGRSATNQVGDVWIPDDASWAATAGGAELAEAPLAGSGTVLAVSPVYMVTDAPTAQRVTAAGGGWLGLAKLVTEGPQGEAPVTLAVRDPAGSGDGLLAAGGVGEAVWLDAGMDASAEALAVALPSIRTVTGSDPALPQAPGEVGLVPEHALLPVLRSAARPDVAVLAATDHTSALRYSWLPAAAAAKDPQRAGALARLQGLLTGEEATGALADAGLRRPDATAAPGPAVPDLPAVTAPMFDVLGPHHVDHVFATWYAADRRSDVLVAVDVSGSMIAQAPGSDRPLIELVKNGYSDLEKLLPDDSELGLWEFGTRLEGPDDHQVLLKRAALDPGHRAASESAVRALEVRDTGTGLHDTLLAAFVAARDGHREGVPNHVVVFTDGRNEADPGSLSMQQLAERLTAEADPARPVQLTAVTFGDQPEAAALKEALEPTGGYVDQLKTADEVRAVFLHVAAGGLHA